MSLLRTVGRTAAISATATSVSSRVAAKQRGRWAEQTRQQTTLPPAEPASPPAPPTSESAAAPAPSSMSDTLAQLQQLGALKTQGILTEAEFEAQKQRILGG